jgi:plastocyanin
LLLVHTGVIVALIIGAGIVVGIALIVPPALCCGGHSHGPSETPEEKITWVSIPEGASSQDSQQIFGPPTIEVVIGTKVGWVNLDFAQMSVLADDDSDPEFFNSTHLRGSDNPTAGSSLYYYENFYYTFTKPVTYSYHCGFHPW